MKAREAILGATCALLVTGSAAAQQAPRQVEVRRSWSPPNPFLITGAVLFGSAYAAAYAVWLDDAIQQVDCEGTHNGWSFFSCDHVTYRMLVVPVAGPWMTLSGGQLAGQQWTPAQRVFLASDGIVQGAGVALLAYGLFRQLTRPAHPSAAPATESVFRVSPDLRAGSAGLTAVVTFD